jgi:hypothetical protein
MVGVSERDVEEHVQVERLPEASLVLEDQPRQAQQLEQDRPDLFL